MDVGGLKAAGNGAAATDSMTAPYTAPFCMSICNAGFSQSIQIGIDSRELSVTSGNFLLFRHICIRSLSSCFKLLGL